MNDNMQEDCAERVHVDQQQLFSERAYYDSGARTVSKKLSSAGSWRHKWDDPLNDSKECGRFRRTC